MSSPVNFNTLPVEVLFEIFSKLSPSFLQDNMRLVCKRFAEVLSDDGFWKTLYRQRYKTGHFKFPLLPYFELHEIDRKYRFGNDISWRDITTRIDKRENLWGRNAKINSRSCTVPHYAAIDAVKILPSNEICVSGGRDKMICLWNLDFEKSPLILAKQNAHNGWVWDIACCQKDQFFTCGWDCTIKGWSLYNDLSCFKIMRTITPPMCLDTVPGLLVAGSNQEISMFDPRIAILHDTHRYKAHKCAVTSLKILGNHIYSISEDKRMCIYDIRNLSLLTRKKLSVGNSSGFPRKLTVYRDLLYVGDSKGSISIFSLKSDFTTPILSLKVGNDRPVNAIFPTLEGVILGTSDAGVQMILPSEPMQIIRQFVVGEVTSMDYYKNYLVVSTTNIEKTLEFYTTNQAESEQL